MTNLNIGEHFIYNGIEFICLDIIDGNYLAMTAEIYDAIPFDVKGYNDWRKSSLRRVLNNDFLSKLNKKHLVMQASDLIADNGDRSYGTSEDYVTILSCDQHRKYREIVPRSNKWMWTLTPWGCSVPNSWNGYSARVVYPTGELSYSHVRYSYGVAPVCLFSSKKLKVSRQVHLVSADE